MKKRVTREIYGTLSRILTELSSIRGALLPLRRIADQLASLERAEHALTEAGRAEAEELRARFAEQVRAVQAERLPDSVELTMAKQVADVARGVLLKLEWSHIDANSKMRNPRCPICHAAKSTGHMRDCALFQVVGPPRAADSE